MTPIPRNAWEGCFFDMQRIPSTIAERLTESELGSYRFRVDDNRVIFDLEGDEIVVLRVGHRREIYRRH